MQIKALYLYDDDKVETVNMSGQLYSINDVDSTKVDAMASMVAKYSLYNSVFAIAERFTEKSEASNIMICGFDSMESRKQFFNSWTHHVYNLPEGEKKHCLYIDGRLAAETLQVICIRGDDDYHKKLYYENFLFSDKEADTTVCSYKQTTYMANMIGSLIVNLFTNFVSNEIVEGIRDLPFFIEYEGESMTFKIKEL